MTAVQQYYLVSGSEGSIAMASMRGGRQPVALPLTNCLQLCHPTLSTNLVAVAKQGLAPCAFSLLSLAESGAISLRAGQPRPPRWYTTRLCLSHSSIALLEALTRSGREGGGEEGTKKEGGGKREQKSKIKRKERSSRPHMQSPLGWRLGI